MISAPSSFVEVRLDDEGKGEGAAAVGIQVKFDEEKRSIELERYGQAPVRLAFVVLVAVIFN